MTPSAPTGEQGAVVPGASSAIRAGLTGWSTYMDDAERVPELAFPQSVDLFRKMRHDAQVDGMMTGLTLPITRYSWSIDPRGLTDDTALSKLCADFGLPLLGDATKADGDDDEVSVWEEHLEQALEFLSYGFAMFEQVGEYDADGWYRYAKLGPRPQWTIDAFDVAADGGLLAIHQPGDSGQIVRVGIERLLAYVWRQEPGRWTGRSMLRSVYRHWLIKDRLLRVDAMKHERNGLGVPIIEVPEGASDDDIAAFDAMAQRYKVGEAAGGAVPKGTKLSLVGVSGTLPDTIGSVRYHDEQIARALLQDVLTLGSTNNGSRALGDTFQELLGLGQDAIAARIARTANRHAIRDWVRINLGEGAPLPRIVYDRNEDDLSTSDLALAVERGIVSVDAEVESWFRSRNRMPAKVEQKDDAPAGQSFGYDLDSGIITIDERRAQIGLGPREDGRGGLTVPEFLAEYGGTTEGAVAGSDPAAPDDVEAGTPAPGPFRRVLRRLTPRRSEVAYAPAGVDPAKGKFRRELRPHEIAAATDFEALQATWEQARDAAVEAYKDARAAQFDELVAAIGKVKPGDLDALAKVAAPIVGADDLAERLVGMAQVSAEGAIAEAKRQGVKLPAASIDTAALEKRAGLVTDLMARDITSAALRKAGNLMASGPYPADEIAALVKEHLDSLTDAYLEERLGGSLTGAQNEGRIAAMGGAPDGTRYYSSELLDANTCSACASIDDTEYASLDEATADYPSGGYINCEGGERCRGTLVAVYGDESEATS